MIVKKNRLSLALMMTVVFFLAALIAGCGKRGDPVPPKITAPKAVSDLKGMIVEGGIVLGWNMPENSIDAAGFKIYRSELEIGGNGCPGCPREYSLIADLSCRDPKLVSDGEKKIGYLDTDVKIGWLYSYKIVACNSSGYCSGESNIVEIMNR